MDRHQRDRLLTADGRRVRLAHVARVAQAHLLDEARQVGAAVALVAARSAHELAHVAEAALAVGRGQRRKVVVVLVHDALEQRGRPELAARAHEPVVELLETLHERAVALRQALDLRELDGPVERPLRGGAEGREPVVGDADERGGEHHEQGVIVEAIAQQREVCAQVAHLLRAIEATAELTARDEAHALERGGVRRRVARRAQQHGDPARLHPAVDELAQAPRQRVGLDLARRGRTQHALPARDEVQLDRRLPQGLDGAQRVRRGEVALVEALAEDMADDGEQLGTGAVAAGQRQAGGRLRPARAEELDVGVAEAVDRLARVAHEDPLAGRPDERVEEPALEAVRVLELVHEHEIEALAHLDADLVALEQRAGTLLEIVEVERELGLLACAIGLAVALEQRRDGHADLMLEARARLRLRGLEQLLDRARGLALGRSEREQFPVARRTGEQRLDPRQSAMVAHRLRAIVAREGRRGGRGGIAQGRQELRARTGAAAAGA